MSVANSLTVSSKFGFPSLPRSAPLIAIWQTIGSVASADVTSVVRVLSVRRDDLGAALAFSHVGELVIVDDCSTDSTLEEIHSRVDARAVVIRHETKRGKGASLRSGFAAA